MSAAKLRGRGLGGLLRDPSYGPYLVGKLLSSFGEWIKQVAGAVLMFQLTGSALMVGAVSMVQFAGPLLLALWAGALADRYNRRNIVIIGRSISAVSVGILAALLLARGVDGFGGPTVLLVTVFVAGLGTSLSSPAMQAMVPDLVPRQDLELALAWNWASPSIARTLGPAMGAGLLVLGGPALAFTIAALSHATFAALLTRVRPVSSPPRTRGRLGILRGVRYLITDREAGLLMLGVTMLGFGADPIMTLTPSLAAEFDGGDGLVGLFATLFGIGAVLLTLISSRLRGRFTLRSLGITGFWLLAGGLVVTGVAPTVWVAAIGFTLAGAGFMMSTTSLNTQIQLRLPDELRGRVMAVWSLAFLGSRPLAAPINGAIADAVSVEAALVVAALIVAAASSLAAISVSKQSGPRA